MMVRRIWLGLIALLLIASTGAEAPHAQDGDFAGLYQRFQQAPEPETLIALGEELLARERGLVTWPLPTARERVQAEVWFALASAYASRPRGERADNLERAIEYFDAALRVWSFASDPQAWARTHNNAGIVHWARIRGERAGNQERAIAHFEQALRVFTRDTSPREWAQLQNNLAIAYSARIHGRRDANIDLALSHFDAALAVFMKESDPLLWATVQNNVGSIYRNRTQGGRADNLEKAVAHLEAALTVFTRDELPHEWASARYNLAMTYIARIEGSRRDNHETALGHLEGALQVFTQEAFPEQWAKAQTALGDAYADRVRGITSGNRQNAIGAYEAALAVFTREAFPREHLHTARRLGRVLMQLGYWDEARRAHAGALDAFRLLFGEGIDETDARALIADAGPLFAEAAYAAAQNGENETALALADEGRARLLAVAMRLQTLDIPDDGRQRLDELRASIRAGLNDAETAQAAERAQALDRVATLRRELLDLVRTQESGTRRARAIAEARRIAEDGGAVVMPLVTAHGGKLLMVTKASGGSDSGIVAIDVPQLTPERLAEVLVGPSGESSSGWIAAYFVNYLDGEEQKKRWPEWLSAIDRLGPSLYRLFAARLDTALKDRGIKKGARVVWLPSGWLGVLPLGLAQNTSSGQRFADDYEIAIAPSLETLATARHQAETAGSPTLAAIVNPTGDLPGADKEGEIVASHFAPESRLLLFHDRATPEAVLTTLKTQTHWHFASHGTFSWADVRQSALVLHGPARLSVGRLLATESLGRPRLVVLSACETGLIEITHNPDEFIGLPGSFMALGAAGVLGTLWPVNDAATALLIAKFYELHIGERLAPATALSRAQAWLRAATNTDLVAYLDEATTAARIAPQLANEMKQELSAEGLRRSRNSAVVEWLTQGRGADRRSGDQADARPFAHPYFWAGFVLTGI